MQETRTVRLSAIWMNDHLEVWNEDCFGPAPEGEWTKTTWTGSIDQRQAQEIHDRAKSYTDPWGPDADAARYIAAAKRTLPALQAVWPEVF